MEARHPNPGRAAQEARQKIELRDYILKAGLKPTESEKSIPNKRVERLTLAERYRGETEASLSKDLSGNDLEGDDQAV